MMGEITSLLFSPKLCDACEWISENPGQNPELEKVLVKGVPCKIGRRNKRKGTRFAAFQGTRETWKAEAMICGIRHGGKFRLYVIPVSDLKNLKCFNIPITGAYVGTSRKPIWNSTRFENAWYLLRDGGAEAFTLTTGAR